MRDLPDHPDITAAMRTGYPYRKQPKPHCCPVCGQEISYLSVLYINGANEVIGCDECLSPVDAEEYFNNNLLL